MAIVSRIEGSGPLVVSMPHSGLALSPGLGDRLSAAAADLRDTDWHVPQLYDFLEELKASVIAATHSRYVIDLNRDPSGVSLYPGQATTGLVPFERFDGAALYRPGDTPDEREIAQRRADYFEPYHSTLREVLETTRDRHGYAVLWDAHSIASHVPRLFDGALPDLNLGTNSGQSCAPAIQRAAETAMSGQSTYSTVSNGRFKGGWITRHYGDPDAGIHVLQMEIGQSSYMSAGPPYAFDEAKADRLRPVLKSILQSVLDTARHLHEETT